GYRPSGVQMAMIAFKRRSRSNACKQSQYDERTRGGEEFLFHKQDHRLHHFKPRVVIEDRSRSLSRDTGWDKAGCSGFVYAVGTAGISPRRCAAISSMSYPSRRTRSSTYKRHSPIIQTGDNRMKLICHM